MSNASGWRAWVPRAAVTAMISAVLVGLFSNKGGDGWGAGDLLAWVRALGYFGLSVLRVVGPCCLVAVMLLQQRRYRLLAWSGLAASALRTALDGISRFSMQPFAPRPSSPFARSLSLSYILVAMATLAMLVLLPRLAKRGTRVQVAAAILIGISTVVEAWWSLEPARLSAALVDVVSVFESGVAVACLALVGVAAGLTLLAPKPIAHDPPADAAGSVTLACPRCGSEQDVATGGGECAHCRLRIWIALAEGRCRRCGYLVRGLTGERCPECGTAIAVSSQSDEPGGGGLVETEGGSAEGIS